MPRPISYAVFCLKKNSAGTQRSHGKNAFFKSGVHQDQQPRGLHLERLDKFDAVGGTQSQPNYEQVRLAFRDLDQGARDAVRLATDNQVRLGVEVSDEAVAKHGVRIHDEDTFFFDGRLPNTPGHCSYERVSKTKSTDKVNALVIHM